MQIELTETEKNLLITLVKKNIIKLSISQKSEETDRLQQESKNLLNKLKK